MRRVNLCAGNYAGYWYIDESCRYFDGGIEDLHGASNRFGWQPDDRFGSVPVVAVPPKVNLGILKLGPSSVTRGNVVTYDIVVVNLSGGTASSVVMTDPIPAGLTFSSVSGTYVQCSKSGCTTRTASCSFASNTVTCTAPSLAPLTSGKLSGLGIQIKGRATRLSAQRSRTPLQ